MDNHDIPNECINDPHFVQVLTAALTAEIATNEKLQMGYTEEMKKLKAIVKKGLEARKNVKSQIKDLDERKALMEPLLEHLTQCECRRTTKLALIKNEMDDNSLRRNAVREKYNGVLEAYKESWKRYKAEFEEFEYAVERRKCRIESEKLKVLYMIKQQQKLDFKKMLEQREKIYEQRIQSAIITSVKMILDIWKKQKYFDEMSGNIRKARNELKIIEEKLNEIQKQSQIEAEVKALARHRMPLPRFDTSLVQSLYVCNNPQSHLKDAVPFRRRIDTDAVSVNTIMFEELCNDEENIDSNLFNENHECINEDDNDTFPSEQQPADSATLPNNTTDPEPDPHIATLEDVCSQLSINDNTCNDTHRTVETEELQCQSAPESQLSQEQCSTVNHPLKHKLPTSEEPDVNEGEPQEKLTKTVETIDQTVSSSPSNKNDPCTETTISQSGKEHSGASCAIKPVPQIKKVETITRPVTAHLKPPMAEVPPTPSSLFSPRHYAPSYASSENLTHYVDNTYNVTNKDICNLDNYSDNWQNLSPPLEGSEISFSPTHVPDKESTDNNVPIFPNRADKPVTNFFSFFNAGSTNPKSFI